MGTSQDHQALDAGLREVDWEAVEETPEFQELVTRRRRFVLPATVFFLAWYLGFIALAGYAPDFMADSVYEGLTVGYCLALTQFIMVGTLGIMYLRRAEKTYDPLADKVAQMVADRGTRFTKGAPVRDAADEATPATGPPASPTPPEVHS
jgi:uncharacterized membrane protein (DUF485 family)